MHVFTASFWSIRQCGRINRGLLSSSDKFLHVCLSISMTFDWLLKSDVKYLSQRCIWDDIIGAEAAVETSTRLSWLFSQGRLTWSLHTGLSYLIPGVEMVWCRSGKTDDSPPVPRCCMFLRFRIAL
jgi:hypothetical protein